jgi:hypothetical protein
MLRTSEPVSNPHGRARPRVFPLRRKRPALWVRRQDALAVRNLATMRPMVFLVRMVPGPSSL